MAIELLEDQAVTIKLLPDMLEERPASATVKFQKPSETDSTALASGSATLGSWSTAVTGTPSSQTDFSVSSVANISAGDTVWLETTDGWKGSVLVSEVTSDGAVTLEAPPPGTVTAGASIYAFELTFDLTAAHTADRDLNYKAVWTVTEHDPSGAGQGAKKVFQQIYHVVRTQFTDAVTAQEASRYVALQYPGYAASVDAGHYEEIAKRASDRVRMRVQGAGAYCHLVGDPSQFRLDAGIHSLRIELARDGLVPPGYDPSQYLSDQERALSRSIGDALRALQWYDADDSGTVQTAEVKKTYTIRAVRK